MNNSTPANIQASARRLASLLTQYSESQRGKRGDGQMGRIWEIRTGLYGWAHPNGSEGQSPSFRGAEAELEQCGAQPSPAPAAPLPFRVIRNAIIDAYQIMGPNDGQRIATLTERPGAKEDAAYIVTACNAFPALVETMEELLLWANMDGSTNPQTVALRDKARAALALAKGR